ncbi:hypothetical protein LB467_12695 [Salegentibacter sp. JZCK2]|uniref:hypothetical protein n=1 Tax=Salegentibacter tibetensis TaxID=2873600 RepID=UPI001CCF7645|nr:hypothetical protein [Salegentibacter tibetensis]MBZ9730545.1 hypothetical protein [Salegentibacter tibetensis]
MKKYLILTILIFTTFQGFSCECPEMSIQKLDSISLENSDLLIIGEITAVDKNGYNIKIQQTLKGNSVSKNIKGDYTDNPKYDANSCAFYPSKNGIYLLYLTEVNLQNEETYISSQCSGSRTMDGSVVPFAAFNMDKKELETWTKQWINKICEE